jgi:hypothetical protein
MSARLHRHLPVDLGDRGSFKDDASDSGYGGSVVGPLSVLDSRDVLDGSGIKDLSARHETTSMQEEYYRENCRLLAGSIEDTKYILKVTPWWQNLIHRT